MNESFCGDYEYEACKNDPECVWCLEVTAEAGAGCLHLTRSSVVAIIIITVIYLLLFLNPWKIPRVSKKLDMK